MERGRFQRAGPACPPTLSPTLLLVLSRYKVPKAIFTLFYKSWIAITGIKAQQSQTCSSRLHQSQTKGLPLRSGEVGLVARIDLLKIRMTA